MSSKPRNFTESIIRSIAVRMAYRDSEFNAMKAKIEKRKKKKQLKRCGNCNDKISRLYRDFNCDWCGMQICDSCSAPNDQDRVVCQVCYR